MKKLSRVAALLASAALLFGAAACSDGSDDGNGKSDPTPTPAPTVTGTDYKWNFAATDLLGNLAWSADSVQTNTTAPSGAEYAKVKLDAAGSYESTPAGLTMNLAAGSQFNKVSPSSSPSSSVTTGASNGFVEPLAGTVVSVSVKGPFTVKANVGANSSSDKTDRYAFIKVGDDEVAAPNKTTTTLPAAGQVLSYTYEGTETVVVSVGGSGITRIYDVIITTANGEAGTKTAGEVISLGSFTSATDESTANDEATLGLVGTEVSSSAEAVATAAIEGGKIVITSVGAGTAVITVTDAEENAATIAVSVNATGAIAIGKITKYVAAGAPTVSYFTEKTADVSATNGDAAVITGGDVTFAYVVDGFTAGTPSAWEANEKNVNFDGVKVGCTSTIKESAKDAKDASLTVAKGEDVGYAEFTVTAVKACTIKAIAATTGQTQSSNLGTAIYVNGTLVNTPAGNKMSTVEQTLAEPVALAAGETATIKVAVNAAAAWSKVNQASVACDMYFANIVVTAEAAAE